MLETGKKISEDDGHEMDEVSDMDDEWIVLDYEEDDEDDGQKKTNAKEDADEKDRKKVSGENEMEVNTGDTVECIDLTNGDDEQQLLHDDKSTKSVNESDKLNSYSKNVDKKNHKGDYGSRLKKINDKEKSSIAAAAPGSGSGLVADESGNKRDDKIKERNKKQRDQKDKSQSRNGSNEWPRGRHPRDVDREIQQRRRERERRQRETLADQKKREERERQRLREREEERRRREARKEERLEEQRLAEERRKLEVERERLEREKAQLQRMERDRQKLQRDKIELERLQLKRQQLMIMEDPVKRSVDLHCYTDASDRSLAVFDAPPQPRFEASFDQIHSDYSGSSGPKRSLDEYSNTKRLEYSNKRGAINDYDSVLQLPGAIDTGGIASYNDDDRSNNTNNDSHFINSIDVNVLTASFGGHLGVNNGMSSNLHGPISCQKSATIEDNNWRPMAQETSRLDRTYNSRSGGYQANNYAAALGPYGGQLGRY